MTPSEIASLGIALVSLAGSAYAALRTYSLGQRQLLLGSRHEFQKLLLEVDKELIHDPELWAVYDNHEMALVRREEPTYRAKLEAFTYMFLNVFQIVYVFMAEKLKTRPHERSFFAAFEGTLRDFVRNSSMARDVLSRPDAEVVYDKGFLDHARSLMKD